MLFGPCRKEGSQTRLGEVGELRNKMTWLHSKWLAPSLFLWEMPVRLMNSLDSDSKAHLQGNV
jgi:hypothetical protein